MKYGLRFAWLGVLLLSGCGNFFSPQGSGSGGSTGGNTVAGDVLYFMNASAVSTVDSSITGYTVSSTGVLAAASNSPYNLGSVPTAMAITPGNTFLYVAYSAGILGYSIGTNGVLTQLNSGQPLSTDQLIPLSMQVDSTGTVLLAASEDPSTTEPEIGVYQIDTSTGALTTVTGSPLVLAQSGNGSNTGVLANAPNQVYITPNNQLVYLTLGSGGTEILTFSASNAALTDTGNFPQPENHRHRPGRRGEQFHQYGAVHLGDRDGRPSINDRNEWRTFRGLGLALQERERAGGNGVRFDPAITSTLPTKAMRPSGGYSVSASGALTALASSPYATGTLPLSLSLDQTGKFLAVASSGGNPNLSVFSFDATALGQLDLVKNTVGTTTAGTSLVTSTRTVSQ